MAKPFPAYKGDNPYVFVCYAHDDSAMVYPDIEWLHDQGFNVWYDEGISPGTVWRNELADSIEGSNLFLYFVTPQSVDSINCQREVNFGVDHGIPVLAVHLEETDLSSGMDLTLSTIQAILKYELTNHDYRTKLLSGASEHIQRGIAGSMPTTRSTKSLRSVDVQDPPGPERYRIVDLVLDVDTQSVDRDGREIQLPKLSFDVLLTLARRAPAVVSTDDLMQEVWGDVVVNDETITQRIKLLRNALGETGKESHIATVRGRGYRLVGTVERLDTELGAVAASVKWRVPSVLVATLVIVIGATWWWNGRSETPPTAWNSIAVLPFVNMTDDEQTEYFSDGMSEALLNRLAQLPGLRVPSRTSSFYFKDKDLTLPEIARELDVATVLEGSVRRSQDRVRITVQLIDARADTHIWSGEFDRELTDVLAVQDEVAAAVVEALNLPSIVAQTAPIGGGATDRTVEAYDRFLQARRLSYDPTPRSLEQAIELLEEANALADYAPAQALLATTYLDLAWRGNFPRQQAIERARQALETALAIDDQSAEVHSAVAVFKGLTGDADGEETALRRAIALNPNYADAHLLLGFNLRGQRRTAEATQSYQTALSLDPFNPAVLDEISIDHMLNGNYSAAITQFQRRLLLQPDRSETYRQMALWARSYGHLDDALLWARKAVELDPEGPLNVNELIMANSALGEFEIATTWLDRAYEQAPHNHWVIVMKAYTAFNRGDFEGLRAFTDMQLEQVPPQGPEPLPQLARVRLSLAGLSANYFGDFERAAVLYERAIGPPHTQVLEPQFFVSALAQLSWAYHKLGRDEEAEETVERCLSIVGEQSGWLSKRLIYPDVIAGVHAVRGEHEEAIAVIARAIDDGWSGLPVLQNAPQFKVLHQYSGFRSLMNELDRRIAEMRTEAGLEGREAVADG